MKLGLLLRRVAEGSLALCLVVMVIAVFGNVVMRYAMGTGWVISEELARLLFVWLVSIAATLAFAENKHLGFDMVTSRATGLTAAVMRWVATGLTALALFFLIRGAWQQVLVGMDTRSPVMNYPLALTAGAIFVMGVSMACLLAAQWWQEVSGKAGSTPSDRDPHNGGEA
jgi:TRAP-type C4-dicarboxylate transport system permease small subunit